MGTLIRDWTRPGETPCKSCKGSPHVCGLTIKHWQKLSAGGDEKAQQCGWLKNKYGISWQVVPRVLIELIRDPDPEKSGKVMEAMLQMKKIDIDMLRRAHAG